MDERPVGPEGVGDFAGEQIAAARQDPRLRRGRGAPVGDFMDAIEEAERTRTLTIWGVDELTISLEREEERLGVHRSDKNLSRLNRDLLQAAWERAELARGEVERDHAHSSQAALISMYGALDAMVEELAPSLGPVLAPGLVRALMARAAEQEPEAHEAVSEEQRRAVGEALEQVLVENPPPKGRVQGVGTERYEIALKKIGLGAPEDRPIPADLDEALAELGALRDVLVHRAGRLDQKALDLAPSLNYKVEEFVRINRAEYRRYSAAVRAYGQEIMRRLLGGGENLPGSLDSWRDQYRLGA